MTPEPHVFVASVPPGGAVGSGGSNADGPPESNGLATALLIAGILIIGATVFRSLRRRGGRSSAGDEGTPAERIAALKARASSRERAQQHASGEGPDGLAAATQIAAVLDQKAMRLEHLIAEADERLARLERAGAVPAPPTSESGDPEGVTT